MSSPDRSGVPGGTESLFDDSARYEEMLDQGIRLSGEGKDFFETGRLDALERTLSALGVEGPRRVLDFGCGPGSTTRALASRFPEAQVVGMDVSPALVERARRDLNSHPEVANSVSYCGPEELDRDSFDLCYTNGVFHHIPLENRAEALGLIRGALVVGGLFALFENNPWNPGTRLVMSRIPFDRDAITISPREARRLLSEGGFEIRRGVESLFYFPSLLSALRPLERPLGRLPLGAQYWILGVSTPGSAS